MVGNPIGGALTVCKSKFLSVGEIGWSWEFLSSKIAELGDTGKQDAHTGGSLAKVSGRQQYRLVVATRER